MFSWLKKHFIPHPGNEHRPHILRDGSTRNIIAIVIFLEIFSFLIPTITQLNISGGMAAILPAVLGELTNEERESQNLLPLAVNPVLNKAAEMKAQDMALKGYFAHTSPEGKTPWYWIELAGYKYQYAGENLAVNFRDSKDVTEAWLKSPTHKANIVKGNYTEIGTGIAEGMYKGEPTIFVAQVYANPLPTPVAAAPKIPAPKVPVKKPTPLPVPPVEVAVEETETDVLGAEVSETPSEAFQDTSEKAEAAPEAPVLWQKLLASPRNTTNILFSVIFAIIACALILYVFIKGKNHHLDLITNGFAVIAIIGAIFTANYHYSYRSMVVTQSYDYSLESK